MSMKATSRPGHRRATTGAQRGRRNVIALLLVGLAVLLGTGPAFADEFYFSRTRAAVDAEQGATGLFLWNDATGAQGQIGGDGTYLRHVTDGPLPVDGLATDLSGNLFGFAIDEASTGGFIPWDPATGCTANQSSRLVSIDPTTGVVSYVGPWLTGRHINGAAFDGQGRLWGLDCTSDSVVQIGPSGTVVGTPIAVGLGAASTASDIDFAGNGMGIIGYGGLQFRVFDPDAGWVAAVPIAAQNNGFDGALVPPYTISGIAFTSHLAARNGSPQADACRLNVVEGRGLDELGHANDPFFANPVVAYKEADQYDPPNRPAGFYNGGPGDAARVGGPALADCFYDWGDAPDSYGTLLASNGARHAIVAGSPYLGADLPDFEVDGQSSAGASGDDLTGVDDEDGVLVPALLIGMSAQIDVTAGNVGAGALLQGWIDWAGDGSFAEPGDQVLVDAAVAPGANAFDIAVPATATAGTTLARFRIANQPGLGFLGLADSGEIEDHQVEMAVAETDLAIVKTATPQTVASGDEVVYTIEATNGGPDAADGAILTDPGVPGSLECTGLTCSAVGGAVCPGAPTPAQLAAGLVIPTLPTGGSVNLELTCTVTATGF
ncbi:DUF11 domain-containing protein [Luteimonas sp. RD2P54]|uniref:DUF11 domain-containing protein n=1 Tax=Luteimonas endophytica TaxID=3042023 RepID=A0ABT6J5Z0_9GAMM|nr:DUF11 domain-containing protein [Luteimonas endophytica]MDH5821962.1 DUF11 domain-containing protein [Luteimonas endophytica]